MEEPSVVKQLCSFQLGQNSGQKIFAYLSSTPFLTYYFLFFCKMVTVEKFQYTLKIFSNWNIW